MATLLEKVLERLPTELRNAYEESAHRGSDAHEIVRLYVALNLWEQGMRQISFEKLVNGGEGENAYADIYEESQKLYVECERYPNRFKVYERRRKIRHVDPTAKFVLAVQDRMGWFLRKLKDEADEVWVVCRDGKILKPQQWIDERKRLLTATANPIKLENINHALRQAEEDYSLFHRLEEEEKAYWKTVIGKAAGKILGVSAIMSEALILDGAWKKYVEQATQQIQHWKTELLKELINMINVPIQLASPYRLRVADEGRVIVDVDWDAWQWLGWKDHPNTQSEETSHYKILWKILQLELKMMEKNLKTSPRQETKVQEKHETKERENAEPIKHIKSLESLLNKLDEIERQLNQLSKSILIEPNLVKHITMKVLEMERRRVWELDNMNLGQCKL